MAVIKELPQIEISVRIAGSEDDCVEYDDPDPPRTPASSGDATHSTSKVIESQDNAEYSICCEIHNDLGWLKDKTGLGLYVYIDGKFATSTLFLQRQLDGQVVKSRLEAVEDSSGKPGKVMVRKFKFSAITRVDGRLDSFDQDRQAAKHLGVIEVIIDRIVFSGGQEKNVRRRSQVKRIDSGRLLTRMTFRYLSKSAPQIEGIIPRDPSPAQERPTVEGMDLVEIKRLAQERLEQIQDTKPIKREASCEADVRPRKVYKTDADGTIDLTED